MDLYNVHQPENLNGLSVFRGPNMLQQHNCGSELPQIAVYQNLYSQILIINLQLARHGNTPLPCLRDLSMKQGRHLKMVPRLKIR